MSVSTQRRNQGRERIAYRFFAVSSPLAALLFCVTGWLRGTAARADALAVADCVQLALARAPSARAARLDADAAAARVRAARAAYAPRLLARGEYGRSAGFDEAVTNGGSTAAVVTVETTLLDGGLRDAQLAAVRARLRSANALEQQRRADITFAVRSAYFAAVAARAEADIQRDSLRTLDAYGALLQRQEQLGLVPYNDVLRAQLAVETARAAARAAAAELDAAIGELSTLTGTELNASTLVEPGVMLLAPVTDALIDASPVMSDGRAAVEAALRDADAVRSEWRTRVTLTADGGALGVEPGPTFRDNAGGQFLLGVSVPLFDGGATRARIAAAVAVAHSAAASLEQSRQTLTVALGRTRVDAQRAQADLIAWQRAVPRAAENFQLMRARYLGGGNVRLLEVLDALAQHVDAGLNVPRASLAYRLAVATAAHIVGEAP